MKAFLILLAFIYMQSVSAGGVTPLDKKDVSLSQAEGKLTSVKEICPKVPGRMTCMAYGSTATVKVHLKGCLDRLGGYFSHFELINGKGVLYFGAINVFNSASRSARCIQAPHETVSIHLPYEGKVELVNVEYTGTIQPQY